MRVLLDTHALLWWWFDDPRLSRDARQLMGDPDNTVLVSAISAFEIATKARIGKLAVGFELAEIPVHTRRSGFQELPLTMEHATAAGALPGEHRDPFDRLLAASALVEGIAVVTADAAISALGAQTLW